jgi:hypothetical protein
MMTTTAPADATCPQHIIDYIAAVAPAYTVDSVEESKSAQQQVLILSLAAENDTSASPEQLDDDWKDSLQRSHQRIVVRIWKAGSRWWNLHQNTNTQSLARAEIHGYRLARRAFLLTADNTQVYIPRILHYQEGNNSSNNHPWALIEYVGPQSILFDKYEYDHSWVEGMITIRNEFGFDEPHPRWGRVPNDKALEYALNVVRSAILPVHRRTASANIDKISDSCDDRTTLLPPPIWYKDMVQVYQQALDHDIKPVLQQQHHIADERLISMVEKLERAIQTLVDLETRIPKLPHVLVHMDMQPQNLLFGRSKNSSSSSSKCSIIRSILDWEEAAIADSRFDLMLVGRKVCANRSQADKVWATYQQEYGDSDMDLGPIEPWLQLETVHSITTLLLQSMNLLGGGRCPWETKRDLAGKLEREFQRLEVLNQSTTAVLVPL